MTTPSDPIPPPDPTPPTPGAVISSDVVDQAGVVGQQILALLTQDPPPSANDFALAADPLLTDVPPLFGALIADATDTRTHLVDLQQALLSGTSVLAATVARREQLSALLVVAADALTQIQALAENCIAAQAVSRFVPRPAPPGTQIDPVGLLRVVIDAITQIDAAPPAPDPSTPTPQSPLAIMPRGTPLENVFVPPANNPSLLSRALMASAQPKAGTRATGRKPPP